MGREINVCVVVRNRSIAVSTLHMLLNISSRCFRDGHKIYIHFIEDLNSITKLIKTQEKLLFVGYGCSLDQESFDTFFTTNHDCLVYPCVTDVVNWDLFKKRLATDEPLHQKALTFDTEVDTKISDGFWKVKKTVPSVFLIDCKSVDKKLRTRKGEGIKIPHDVESLFTKFKEQEVKCVAYTKANILVHKHYECVGNIMECATVRYGD